MKILIMGGTRFFGKRLTTNLIAKGHDVTLLTRGNSKDDFGDAVKRITCDRLNFEDLKNAMSDTSWDIVYDQVCFDYKAAKEACEIFNDKAKRYIFTSTVSVYEGTGELAESDFNPQNYQFKTMEPPTGNYGEAKRQAEAAFTEFCTIPCVYVRFPIVIGEDDYTKRFSFHVDMIKNNTAIYIPNREVKMSFISSQDAAQALEFFGFSDLTGAFNVASPEAIKISEMISLIEKEAGNKAIYAESEGDKNHSPYGIGEDWYISCDKLKKAGLQFKGLSDYWIPKITKQLL